MRKLLLAGLLAVLCSGAMGQDAPVRPWSDQDDKVWLEQLEARIHRLEYLHTITSEARARMGAELSSSGMTPEDLAESARALRVKAGEALRDEVKSVASPASNAWAQAKKDYESLKRAKGVLQAFKDAIDKYFSPDLYEDNPTQEALIETIEKRGRQIHEIEREIDLDKEAMRLILELRDQRHRAAVVETNAALTRSMTETKRIFAAREAAVADRREGFAAEVQAERQRVLEARREAESRALYDWISGLGYGDGIEMGSGFGMGVDIYGGGVQSGSEGTFHGGCNAFYFCLETR